MQATICVARTIAASKLEKLQRYGCTVTPTIADTIAGNIEKGSIKFPVAVIVCGGNATTEIWHDVCREYLPYSS